MSYAHWVDTHCTVKEKLANDEWLILCPFHDNKQTPSCCVNVKSGKFICYSCDAKGGMQRLSEKVGGTARPIYDLKGTKAAVRKFKMSLQEHDEKVEVHPDDWLDQYRQDDSLNAQWGQRGISGKTVNAMGLGYAQWRTQKHGNLNTLVIPVRDVNNRVLGIVRRAVGDDLPPGQRYFYPMGFKISWHLFGVYSAALIDDKPLVITEGSIDSMLMWQAGYPSVSLLGAALHPHQRSILRSMPHDQIVLMLDFDKPGQEATMKIAPQLVADGFDVRIAQPPCRTVSQVKRKAKLKDAGDMTPMQRNECVEDALSYLRLRMDRVLT